MDTRRRTLLMAGAAGTAGLLAGCTTENGVDSGAAEEPAPPAPGTADPGPAQPPGTGAGQPPAEAAGKKIAGTADIPVGGGKIFAEERVVVVQPTAGEFKAFSAVCPHRNCLVSRIADGTIDCTCHDSRFSLQDGSVTEGPSTSPLPPEKITVTKDSVLLP
ncbi:Rieske (2Fe-2S) protein [Streptomyces sp. NPDC004838]